MNLHLDHYTIHPVTDADVPAQPLTYSLSGVDAAKFTINSGTGVLTFGSAPNFEAPTDAGGNNVYDVIVQASDGVLFDAQAIAVTVADVNEAPNAGADFAVSVPENTAGTGTATVFTFGVAPFIATTFTSPVAGTDDIITHRSVI